MNAPAMQPELFSGEIQPADKYEIEWMVAFLEGKGWMTAAQILRTANIEDCDARRRRLRFLASHSDGRIAGGQQGYRLVREMTREEYEHFRCWMTSQASDMQRRVVECDKVFFVRKPVHPDNGILTPH